MARFRDHGLDSLCGECPLVGGEVKVDPPVSNLPVSNLENPDERQIDFLIVDTSPINSLGEDEIR